jgi:type II secretory pathway component GspD/PulD (secretin)
MSTHGKLPLFALTVAAITFSIWTVPGPARADGEVLDRKVNVSLADSAPDQAFQGFATMIGLEAVVEPGLNGKVTVRLQNVRMRTVLDAVCESIGCRWSVEAGTPAKLYIRPLPARSSPKATVLKEAIDLRVTKADVREVLQTFGQILSANVDLDSRITGSVSFELNSTPVGEALDQICAMVGCEWKLDTDGEKPVLRVVSKK